MRRGLIRDARHRRHLGTNAELGLHKRRLVRRYREHEVRLVYHERDPLGGGCRRVIRLGDEHYQWHRRIGQHVVWLGHANGQ